VRRKCQATQVSDWRKHQLVDVSSRRCDVTMQFKEFSLKFKESSRNTVKFAKVRNGQSSTVSRRILIGILIERPSKPDSIVDFVHGM